MGKKVLHHTSTLFLIVLGMMTMFTPMSTDIYLPSFPMLAKDFGIHISEIQLTLTSFMLGSGLGQIVWGPISDRYGRKIPSYIGVTTFFLASFACSTSTSLSTLVIYRFIQAFGGSAALVCSRAIVRDLLHGVEMAKMMSAMSMIFVFAPAFAPSIATLILHWFSWRAVFYALMFFGALVLFGLFGLPESLPKEKRNEHGFKESAKTYGEILRNKEFRRACIITMAGSFVTFGYVSSAPAVVMGIYGQSRANFGFIFALISIGLLSSSQINIRLVAKFGTLKMLRGFTLAQTSSALVLMALAIVRAPLWMLLIPVVVIFGCAPGMGGNVMTHGMHPFPHKAASAAAFLGLMQMMGSASVSAILAQFHNSALINMCIAILFGASVAFVQVRKLLPHAESIPAR